MLISTWFEQNLCTVCGLPGEIQLTYSVGQLDVIKML